ncbi:MAG: FAD-dependent oxidoreductase [Acetivibrionales bacterium]|jgi:NADPH-dependent 2,4-dienoyl-CoA reductase/sulfur reductase-like enzyme/peroxiredoxin family protein/rhodanese-related sulfurtransferase/TusA-related sulfurtransferase
MNKKVLIVGGVAGGATAAARLRRLDEHAQIIMFERGDYISFANCGLPYYIGDVITDREKLTLQSPESFKSRLNVEVRIRSEVVRINRDKKTVEVRESNGKVYEESYDYLILSPGAEPIVPPIEGAKTEAVFTLRNIPDTYRIKNYVSEKNPKSAVVVGAGYIGIEMAENLHALGLDVTIVELSDHVIQPLDYDMAAEVHKHIQSKGVALLLNRGVTSLHYNNGTYEVKLSDGESFDADMVILAVGVRPESSLAKDAGLKTGVRDTIVTDNHMKTNDPYIYAVGDAAEVVDVITGGKAFVPLASPANRQGRIAADNIAGIDSVYGGTLGTAILKAFDMTVATTGCNERALKNTDIEYEKSFTFSASNASYYPGTTYMTIKLLFEKKSGKILGAQIVGYKGVDKRIDVLATAIKAGMTVFDLTNIELSYAPPFGSAKDPVNMAGYVASNIVKGDMKIFHWHDVKDLDLEKVTILDVRTPEEYTNGSINGSLNIPVDDLRERISELDSRKPVYVFCQIGLRGYIASRILIQNSFDNVYNLSGGYRLLKAATTPLKPFPGFGTNVSDTEEKNKNDHELMELSEKGTISIDLNDSPPAKRIFLDACGLQCPGPILKVSEAMKSLVPGEELEILATDPAFATDVEAWCKRTGNELVESSSKAGQFTVVVRKGTGTIKKAVSSSGNSKNIIVFSGDLDKAIAAFIIANGSAAMGREVNMFFTFWGLNILRKTNKVRVKKNFIEKMFGFMMPRGTKKLGISKMNMMGMGPLMIRKVMKHKNISSVEELIDTAIQNGVNITACSMSMDVMGIKKEELIDGIKMGGVAAMLASAEESDMSLFI